MADVQISVIVPVHNGAPYVDYFVDSISCLSFPKESYELLLVDNGSDDDAAVRAHRQLTANGINCRLAHLTAPKSSYAARNMAVGLSRGKILAFTDFDCRPTPAWLTALIAALEECDVAAGGVEFVMDNPKSLWEQLDSTSHMQNAHAADDGTIATANMAVRRSFFDRVGPFASVVSGADFDWSRRATAAGARISYRSEALVLHPTRKDYIQLRDKFLRIARGDAQITAGSRVHLVRRTFRAAVKLPFLPRSARIESNGFLEYTRFRTAMLWIRVLQLGIYVGALYGQSMRNSDRRI